MLCYRIELHLSGESVGKFIPTEGEFGGMRGFPISEDLDGKYYFHLGEKSVGCFNITLKNIQDYIAKYYPREISENLYRVFYEEIPDDLIIYKDDFQAIRLWRKEEF